MPQHPDVVRSYDVPSARTGLTSGTSPSTSTTSAGGWTRAPCHLHRHQPVVDVTTLVREVHGYLLPRSRGDVSLSLLAGGASSSKLPDDRDASSAALELGSPVAARCLYFRTTEWAIAQIAVWHTQWSINSPDVWTTQWPITRL